VVEQVIVKDDEHPVFGDAEIELVPVPAQLECDPVGLERVLVSQRRRLAVAVDAGPLAAVGDRVVPAAGVVRGLCHGGREGPEQEESDGPGKGHGGLRSGGAPCMSAAGQLVVGNAIEMEARRDPKPLASAFSVRGAGVRGQRLKKTEPGRG
jgi:hypothetical protein